MIPKKLEIQGLYSYQEKQVVDFEQLTAAGLFGIFGAVGSGKSSILEAILLSLYGSTERLSVTGERNSMMNLQSDQLLVNFEFQAGKSNDNSFLARYSAKRNKKNPEKIDSGEHTIYQKVNGEWEALAKTAEQILGMKKAHFKQTVIIPQGKFREFIDLKPREQADMMKELFGLQRFDLSQQTGSLIGAVKEDIIRLETQLGSLSEVNSSILSEKKTAQEESKTELTELSQKLEAKQARLRALEKVKEKKDELDRFSIEMSQFQIDKPAIDAKKQYHERFRIAKNQLRPTWEQLKSIRLEIEKNTVSVEECTRWENDYVIELKALTENLNTLEQLNKDRPNRESKIRDLKQALDIKALQEKLATAKQAVNRWEPEIKEKRDIYKTLRSQIKEMEEETSQSKLPNPSTLANWKSWVREYQQTKGRLTKIEVESESLKESEKLLLNRIELLNQSIPEGLADLTAWRLKEKETLEYLEKETSHLNSQSDIAVHLRHLQDGKPCPLCGSKEHPNPISEGTTSTELIALDLKMNESKKALLTIQELEQTKAKLDYQSQQNAKELKANKLELETSYKSQSELDQQIKETGFETIESLSNQIQQVEQEFEIHEARQSKLLKLRKESESLQSSIEKLENAYQLTKKQFDQIESAIATKRDEIRDLDFTKGFMEKEPEVIQGAITKVEKSIQESEEKLDGARKHLQDRKVMQSQNATSLKMYQKLLHSATEKRKELVAQFESKKLKYGFSSDQELKNLFEDSLDEEKVGIEIRKFEDRFHLVQSRINELNQDEALAGFNPQEFVELKEFIHLDSENLETKKSALTLIEEAIKRMELDLLKKKELEDQLAKVSHRHSHLKELDVLFRGGGFVKFVSSIYLRELCNTANVRFMKLTKNQLSLDIDTNNTFWVIDYLNGGKKRLLKTLSGGQTFQASLCLALALAEKIKALNQADQSFFFMDEGFGALDKNSLGVVFDTLKSLQFENRIVGIISHVEELQHEIGVYAKVELDPDEGSQISYSFT